MIIDAQAAARIHRLQLNPLAAELPHQLVQPLQSRAERIGGTDLRSDMHAHPVRLDPAVPFHAAVNRRRAPDVDAELVLAQPRRNVGMRLREHVGIHAQRKTRFALQPAGARRKQFELRLALHVEFENARFQRAVDLGLGLAHSGEHHAPRRIRSGRQHALQFPARNDIEPRPALRKQLENRQRGVGLHRIAHQVIAARERFLKHAAGAPQSDRPNTHTAAFRKRRARASSETLPQPERGSSAGIY